MTDHYLTLVDRFVTVAETGTIIGAAQKLNLSQPALTQSIRRIEEIFECTLFERTKKGVVLTLTGQILFERSRRMLQHSNLAKEEISDIIAGRSGSLRIAAGTVWGTQYLPTLIHRVQTRFPELRIELDILLTPDGLQRLHSGDVDLVVGGVDGDQEPKLGFTQETLLSMRYSVGCGQNSPLAGRHDVTMQQVAELPLVLYHEDELLMSNVINDLETNLNVSFKRAVLTRSVLVAIQMVMEGPYVLFLAEEMFRRFADTGIEMIDLRQRLPAFKTAMFYRDSLRQTEPFTMLLQELRATTNLAH